MTFDMLTLLFASVGLVTLSLCLHTVLRRHRIAVTIATSCTLFIFASLAASNFGRPVLDDHQTIQVLCFIITSITYVCFDVLRVTRHVESLDPVKAARLSKSYLLSSASKASMALSFLESLNTPAWVCTPTAMLYINKEYLDRYSKTEEEYYGEQHKCVWDTDRAAQFSENDRVVLKTGEAKLFIESAPTVKDPTRVSSFFKFPIRDTKGNIVAVGGIEIEIH